VNVSGGVLNGELIGGNVNLSSSAHVIEPPPPMVPEANAGLVLIPFIGAILLFAARHFLRSKAAQSGLVLTSGKA
jgi:hypothetical protein